MQIVHPEAEGAATAEARPPFYGWRVVGAAFVLAAFGWGLGFYGPPIYLESVRDAQGWPIALVSTAVTAHFLIGAGTVANLPRLYGRFGLPRVTKAGALCLGTGIVGWAMATAPWQLFIAAFASGVGWATMGAAAVNAIVSPWFMRRRPAALGMAYNGASIGGVIFSPLWVVVIKQLGFPIGALLIAAATGITVWFLADRVFARTPQALGLVADGDGPSADAPAMAAPFDVPLGGAPLWRDPRFLTLAAGMALGLFAQIGLIAHLYSLLVPAFGAEGAGLLMGSATAMAIAGRSLVAWWMPVGADRRLVACASYGVQIAGSMALLLAGGASTALLLMGVLLFGAGIGNATSLPPLIAQLEFAREDVARVVALIVALSQAAYAFAPAAFGLVRASSQVAVESAGGAAPYVFAVAGIIQAGAIGAFLAGRRR